MGKRETSIQGDIIKWLNAQKGCAAENVRGNATQSGRADINACVHGRAVKLEVKRPDSSYDVTEKQRLYLRRWRRAGAVAVSVESLDEVKALVKQIAGGEL